MPEDPKEKIALNQFGTGALKSPYDPRDYVFRLKARGITEPFDWELGFDIELLYAYRLLCKDEQEFFGSRGRDGWGYDRYKEIVDYCKKKGIKPKKLKPYNQNGSGSCVGQSMAKYLTMIDLIETGVLDDNSARDIYSYIFQPGSGAFMRDAIDRAIKVGVAKERLVTSYNAGKPPTENFMRNKPTETPEILSQRTRYQAKGYFKIEHTNDFQDRFAWAMLLNFGVFFSVDGDDNGHWNGNFPQVGQSIWGHALYAGKAALKNGKPHCGHQNSWGGVGDNGWQWLNPDWYKPVGSNPPWSGWNPIDEAWTIQDKSNNPNPMQSNTKIIKLVYPDGRTEIALADPSTNPSGFISATRNRGIEIPLKPGDPNDVDWSKVKIDGVVSLASGEALGHIPELEQTSDPA